MNRTINETWNPLLQDPSRSRREKPRSSGLTMVIDKGMGGEAFRDLLDTAGRHIDLIKIGFGTSPLYPERVLRAKIAAAKAADVTVFPGGTFLEVAVKQNAVDDYFRRIIALGFTGIEVSDGTIDLTREERSRLIRRGVDAGLAVFTEYGKKNSGSSVEPEELAETVGRDLEDGARLVTVEARESGEGVGIFDENGDCRDEDVLAIFARVDEPNKLMWEAPQKKQQVRLFRLLGPAVNIGNVSPADVLSLEALRRGLRSDTFSFGLCMG